MMFNVDIFHQLAFHSELQGEGKDKKKNQMGRNEKSERMEQKGKNEENAAGRAEASERGPEKLQEEN